MKFIKLSIYSLLLIFFFLYGVGTGLYRWVLFTPLQNINKTFKKNVNGKITYIWNGVRKSNNEKLLAELAKTNNISLENNLMDSKLISSQLKSDSMKIISFGDNESEIINVDSINAIKDKSLIIHVGDSTYQCEDIYYSQQYE